MAHLLLSAILWLLFPVCGAAAWFLTTRRLANLHGLTQSPVHGLHSDIMLEQAPREAREKSVRSEKAAQILPQSARVRVLIVGAGDVGRTLAHNLEAGGKHEVIGFADDEEVSETVGKWRVLGKRSDTVELVQAFAADEVVVAYAPTWQQMLTNQLAIENPNVGVRVVPSVYESLLRVSNVENYGDIALISLTTYKLRDPMKRVADTLAALFGLIVLSPVTLIVALLIKISSPGPVLFVQDRTGRFGKTFRLYKFRTMVADAEARTGPVLANGTKDNRLTPIGRWLRLFRFDEIPQLWNVLRGEMSLVGPRPERPVFVNQFVERVPAYAQRHLVRPGITGLAQVCGGYHTDARDKLRFDLIYVSHRSLWLDLSILLRTVLVVFLPNPQTTPEKERVTQ